MAANDSKRELLILVLFVFVTTLPFCRQALHIDDPPVVYLARAIVAHPGDIYHDKYRWHRHEESLAVSSKGLLVPALTAALMAYRIPEAEFPLHLINVIILLIGMGCFYRLSGKVVPRYRFWATIFFISLPSLAVSAHTLMPDLAVAVGGLAFLTLALEDIPGQGRLSWGLGGLALFAALMAKSSAVVFFILALSLLIFLPARRTSILKMLLVFIALLMLWSFYHVLYYNRLPFLAALHGTYAEREAFSLMHFLRKGTYYLLSVGLDFFWLIPFWLIILKRKEVLLNVVIFLVAGGIVYYFIHDYQWTAFVEGFFLLASGSLILSRLIDISWREFSSASDSYPRWLIIWAWVGMLLPLAAPFGALRHLLPGAGGLVLLFFLILEKNCSEKYHRRLIPGLVLLSTFTGVLVSLGAYQSAGVYRELAKTVQNRYAPTNTPIWTHGRLGFQYYLGKIGAIPLVEEESRVKPNDLIIETEQSAPVGMPPALRPQLKVVESFPLQARIPIHTLNYHSHAGFFSEGWGLLPFAFSFSPLDKITVYQVEE